MAAMTVCAAKPLRSTLILLVFLAALALAACGGEDGPAGTDGPNPATLTPPEAPIYFEAAVQPEGDLRENVDSVLGKLLDTGDPGAEIASALEGAIDSDPDYADFSFGEDVDPWLGQTAGGFITEFSGQEGEGALLVAITDADAATEATRNLISASSGEDEPELTERTYEGTTYQLDPEDGGAYGIVDDFLVVGTEQGLKDAVDAAAGESLAGNGEATEELDSVREASIIAALFDVPSLIDLLESSGELPPDGREQLEAQLGDLASGQIAFSAGVETDALTFDYISPAAEGASDPPETLTELSADAWLAFAAADVGEMINQNIEGIDAQLRSQSGEAGIDSGVDLQQMLDRIGLDLERDLGWIGDTSLFVEGSSLFDLGGGVRIEATDTDDAAGALDKLRELIDDESSVQTEDLQGGEGFRIGVEGVPAQAEVELRDGQVAVAVGSVDVDAVLDPAEPLGDSPEFQSAREKLGEDLVPSLYLDFKTVTSLLESTGQSDPQLQQVIDVLGALDLLVAGSTVDSGKARGSAVLGVREPPASGEPAVIVP